MKKALIAAAVLGLMIAATSATAGPLTIANCGKIKAGGRTWHVAATVVACAKARTVVRTLAPKPVAKFTHYRGKYFGMGCLGAVKGARREIQCAGTRGQSVIASTKA
jgi:hypothetical protein